MEDKETGVPRHVVDFDGSDMTVEEPWDGELAVLREFVEAEERHSKLALEGAEERFRRCVFRLRYRRNADGRYEYRREATGEVLGKAPVMRTLGLKPNGASWEEVGAVFGCSGEAVRKRFGAWAEGEAARTYAEELAEEQDAWEDEDRRERNAEAAWAEVRGGQE